MVGTRTRTHTHTLALTLPLVVAALACGPQRAPGHQDPDQAPAATATADATATPDGTAAPARPADPSPALRVGPVEPDDGGSVTGTVMAQSVDSGGAHEFLELSIPAGAGVSGTTWERVVLEPPTPGVLAVVEASLGASEIRALVRRKVGANAALRGAALGTRWQSGRQHRVRTRFQIAAPTTAPHSDSGLASRWTAAMAKELRAHNHPWDQFAAGRLLARSDAPARLGSLDRPTPPRRTDLTELMDTTTGWLSMQEALQHDRGLRLRGAQQTATVPLEQLTTPRLDEHPWSEMLRALPPGERDVARQEPLSAAAPSDFWYARVDDIRLLLRLLHEADTWITPVVQIMQQNPEDRRLSRRYQRQLGLRPTGLAEVLGHTAVGEVALVGSDPYLREGSDVTMIFKVRQQALLDAELQKQLESYRAEVPGLASASETYEGVTIAIASDPRGLVRQHRAQVGELAFVSNSKVALQRVLDATSGRSPRLADEPELAYMLARDPGPRAAFAYLSDKFIANVIGPRQKVLAARRQRAIAELSTPGYAALLYGWLHGQAPASTQQLVDSGLLFADELQHGGVGEAIAFTPGQAARSSWGELAALTPLIDRPEPALVTEDERQAYERFARTYQNYWKRFIDPVAIRLNVHPAPGGGEQATIDVRVLPLISGTDYSDIERVVGGSRVESAPDTNGLLAVWAVGDDVGLRRDLNGLMRAATGSDKLGIDWLGSWVAVGAADRGGLTDMLWWIDDTVQAPAPERAPGLFEDNEAWRRLGNLPVFAMADVKNPAALVATLTGVRTMANDVAPGIIEWGEHSRYRDIPLVRIGMNPNTPMLLNRAQAEAVAIYYAQTGSTIALALVPEVLHGLIDRMLDDGLPKGRVLPNAAPARPDTPGDAAPLPFELETPPQFVLQTSSDAGYPLWTAILWAIQGQANGAQASARRSAEILLRGQPSLMRSGPASAEQLAALGLAYLGSAPMTAHGDHAFTLGPDGPGDAVQGSVHRPIHGPLPYEGSPVEALMERLTGVRAEVAFDREPAVAGSDARSLHTRFALHLGEP